MLQRVIHYVGKGVGWAYYMVGGRLRGLGFEKVEFDGET